MKTENEDDINYFEALVRNHERRVNDLNRLRQKEIEDRKWMASNRARPYVREELIALEKSESKFTFVNCEQDT